MKHLIEPLQKLGLSEKEALVYLTLLQLGPATPYQIAKKADLKRPTAYVIAEELIKKGMIVHVPGEERKKYIARTPDVFIEDQEERLQAAREILPELRSFQKGTIEKPSIMYFEGMDGLHQAYQYRQKDLHGKEIVGFFASNDDSPKAVADYFLEWNQHRQKRGTRVRGITVDSPDLKHFSKLFEDSLGVTSLKFLPRNVYNSKISIESCDQQFVRILLFESVETLIIESPKLAVAIKDIFELTWRALDGKYDNPVTFEK